MSNTPKISIVVPIYNVEAYLDECVQSILSQTHNDFELILVDDGSKDNCGKMCDEYALQDERIKVIHKQNGGLSDARNAGIELAVGEYITFIDSDDGVAPTFLEMLLNVAEENHTDIVQCGNMRDEELFKAWLNNSDKTNNTSETIKNCRLQSYNSDEALKSFLIRGKVTVTAWGKLYRTSLFKVNRISYPVGKLNEDDRTTYKLIYKSNGVVTIENELYFYRKREGSIMNQPVKKEHLELPEVAEEIKEYLSEVDNEKYEKEIDFYRFGAMNVALEHLLLAENRKDFQLEEKSLIKQYVKTDKSNPYLSLAHKIAIDGTKISPSFLKILFKVRTNK